jgi:hypothetical protein
MNMDVIEAKANGSTFQGISKNKGTLTEASSSATSPAYLLAR